MSNGDSQPITGTTDDTVKLLLGICEGQIEGISSLKDIYFDKTPYLNNSGTPNFKDVAIYVSDGAKNPVLPWMFANDGISGTFNVNPVNLVVKNDGVGITRSITNADINQINIRLSFLAEYQEEDGDRKRTDFCFSIEIKEGLNGDFVTRAARCVNARYPDFVTFKFVFPVDSSKDYFEVRVKKTAPEEPPNPDERKDKVIVAVKWADYTEVSLDQVLYSNTALLALTFPAKTFESNPEVWAKVKGIKDCKIPSNATINATDKGTDFNGGWDGTLYTPSKATADPAWIVYYLLTNPRFRLGIPESYIDKFALYQCSVYNNQFVSNGDGGTERRFLFNTILGSGGQESVLEMVRAISSTMYAKPYWNGSQISFWQERPMSALPKILTNADVEEGKFVYQTRELNTVTTVAKVSYQSTIEDWELVPEIVEEPASIDRYGYQTEEYALLGETRRAAAIRSGRRTILSSLPNAITLTCKIRARAMFFQPGDVIQVSDTARNKVRVGGLVSAVTANKITLDAPITLTANTGKKIYLTLPDESVIERAIANPAGTFTEINLSAPLTTLPLAHSPWQIVDEISRVKLYRITDVVPDSENRSLFEVTAKTYSEDFFTQVETGIKIPSDSDQNPLPTEVNPPNNFSVQLLKVVVNDNDTYSLVASWQRPLKEQVGTKFTASSLSFSQGIATVTTSTTHNYQSNDLILISGSNQSIYNDKFVITKTSNTQFTFPFNNSTINPATGTITAVRLIEENYTKSYRLQYKKSNNSEWSSLLEVDDLFAAWDNLSPGNYTVRIAAVTTNNKVSQYIQAVNVNKLIAFFDDKNNSFFAGDF